MRIFEIDDVDKTWAASKGISLKVDELYAEATDLINIMVKSNSPSRNKIFISGLDMIENNLTEIINAEFAPDEESKMLKSKAANILAAIRKDRLRIRI